MRSPAFAIAWQLWTRHRSGIVTALATLAATIALAPLLPLVARLIASSTVLILVIAYFMNIVLFTESVGNMASTYPRRMYALPVPSRTLVGWPMLYGGGVVALLWMTVACLVYRPSGFPAPVFLPALGFAAVIVWLQAFAWAPIKNPFLKVALPLSVTPLLIVMQVWGFWLSQWGAFDDAIKTQLAELSPPDSVRSWITEPVVLTMLVMVMATAYAVARIGIASDRRGDSWRVLPREILRAFLADRPARQGSAFCSPARAQLWYEWTCHGLVIPLACSGLVLLATGPTFFSGRHFPGGLQIQLPLLLLLPMFTVAPISLSIGNLRPFHVKSRAFITFLATRPMNSGALVAAKLRMIGLSVLLMYLSLVVEIMLWIVAVGYTSEAGELWRFVLTSFPGWKAAAVLLLGALTLMALTWSLATSCLPLVLTGRNAIVIGFNLAIIAGTMAFGAAVVGLRHHPEFLARLIAVVPWLVACAIGIKLIVASLAFRACVRQGLIRVPSLITIVATALALAACAIALARLLSEARLLPVPMSVVPLAIVILVPLSRFALAPLALEWNRHR